MWVCENVVVKKHLLDFANRQEEYIEAHPDDWNDNDPLFCEDSLKPLDMEKMDGKNAVEDRKADRNPPQGEKVLWRIGRFYGDTILEDKKYILLMRLQRFWTDERTLEVLVPIITRKTKVTPCLLDFLCVNHSKNPAIIYSWDVRGVSQLVNIFKRYNDVLKIWHRGCFDPHRRVDPLKPDRVWFDVQNETHSTTVAQLHFLHWCWAHGVLHYAEEHFEEIKKDHMAAQQVRKRKRDSGTKQKREEIKKAAKTPCQIYFSPTSIEALHSDEEYDDEE